MCKYVYVFLLVYVYAYADALKTKRAFCAFFCWGGVGWGGVHRGVGCSKRAWVTAWNDFSEDSFSHVTCFFASAGNGLKGPDFSLG